ncbi:MAG: nickel pincer cofactor biosynthesis protein LarC [Nitrospirales bacterium]|nr:MAG: nickel pincer cofactor biosynthesis protein LarC [Nitrospirales bacterium]
MTRHLHIDAFSGVSGDMFLGALVDTCVPLQVLEKGLKGLGIKGYRLREQQVIRNSLRATKVDVDIQKGFTKPLALAAIKKTLKDSRLPDLIRTQALQTFQLIAEAEGTVHGKSLGKVHFHEVGVIDSLVDIVGTLLGLTHLNVTTVSCSPINLGAGTISTAHGLLPVPGPAVAQMAKGISVYSNGPALELTTPTGMALIRTLSQNCKTLPPLTPHTIGYGAGTADPEGWPNVLRLFLGKEETLSQITSERIIQLETSIDDMNPQFYDQMMTHLFDAGALDVTLTPTMMKRNRPGTIVSVLAWPQDLQVLTTILLSETTTLGVRVQELERAIVPRQIQPVRLPHGSVRVKIAKLGNGQVKITPEYRDCAALAERTKQPVQTIIDLARQTFVQSNKSQTTSRSKKSTKNPR